MNAKLKTVVIKTPDVQKTLAFYGDILDYSLDSMVSVAPGKQIAFMRQEGSDCLLEIMTADPGRAAGDSNVSLSFVVEQIGPAEKALADNKVRISAPPRTIKDGKKIMTAVDPNGVELHFIEE